MADWNVNKMCCNCGGRGHLANKCPLPPMPPTNREPVKPEEKPEVEDDDEPVYYMYGI